jgi:hypothetical protein
MSCGVFAMFEEHGRDAGMAGQNAGKFGPAIAPISDDSSDVTHWLFIHYYV